MKSRRFEPCPGIVIRWLLWSTSLKSMSLAKPLAVWQIHSLVTSSRRSVAWHRACFGSRRSLVQIQPFRLEEKETWLRPQADMPGYSKDERSFVGVILRTFLLTGTRLVYFPAVAKAIPTFVGKEKHSEAFRIAMYCVRKSTDGCCV